MNNEYNEYIEYNEYNDTLYEYNLINNIPIMLPLINNNIIFCPRYDIVTPDLVLNYFKNNNFKNINIKNTLFKYIKINLNSKYKNGAETLYCYLLIENRYLNDNIIKLFNKIDISNIDIDILLEWLIINDSNNNFIITCPVLKYKHLYYSISNNDKKPSIIKILDSTNNINVIIQLIATNCFTICDNYILIISLFQKNIINKKNFKKIIKILNNLDYKYTNNIWIYLMNMHKLFCVCDYPYFYLSRTPYKIDKDIIILFQNLTFNNIYLQSTYKDNTFLFTSLLSNTYPYTDKKFILNNNPDISKSLWNTNSSVDISYSFLYKKTLFVPDLYGLFASISSVNSMWKYWIENKSILLKTILNNFKKNYYYTIVEILSSLFELYNNGFGNRNIRKNKIRQIWIHIINILDINKNIIPELLNIIIVKKNVIKLKNIPYIFLLNIYQIYNINLFEKKILINNINYNSYLYKNTSLYQIIKNYNKKDNLYNINKNIIKKKIIYILMCFYKKFNMFNNKNINDYRKGICLIEYFKNNKSLFL